MIDNFLQRHELTFKINKNIFDYMVGETLEAREKLIKYRGPAHGTDSVPNISRHPTVPFSMV